MLQSHDKEEDSQNVLLGPVSRDRVDPAIHQPSEIYDHRSVEARWQAVWQQTQIYEIDVARAIDRPSPEHRPFYNLMMFPYPSAEGLHVGNVYAFTGADIYGRFMAMNGNLD